MSSEGREHDYRMGTEIGMLRDFGLQGQVTAGDGSDKNSKMGAGYDKLRGGKKAAVQSGTRGSSSNQSEQAAFY